MLTLRITAAALLLATPTFAQDMAKGDAIEAAIAGNTVQGSMTSSGSYTEFYDADGKIKGDGYSGSWMIDGDKMCFAYAEDEPVCYAVKLNGDQVTWLSDDGNDGTGTIIKGNPNNY
jgi:hypothetical protein